MNMSLEAVIQALGEKALGEIEGAKSADELDELRGRYLGKKGELTGILKGLKDLSPEEKKAAGAEANRLREQLEKNLNGRRQSLKEQEVLERVRSERYDALRPIKKEGGHLHPITRAQYRVEDIFTSMGFQVIDGPEVETDDNNFTRLNFSDDHPARDEHDTFWTTDGTLLRTHTSPVQVRAMQTLKPPFRVVVPGRVFRCEELDATHENTFHQVEGMMVDKNVSVAHLNYVVKTFLSAIFEKDIHIRLRPGYFPFVEPGFECDIAYPDENGKLTNWMEFLGCGLIHPNVLRAGGIDPNEWSGFAFGMGLDRLTMLMHEIEDIRHFMSGNLRFLSRFPGA